MGHGTRTCIDCEVDIAHRYGNAKRCVPCGAAAAVLAQSEGRPRVTPCVVDDEHCVPGRLRLGLCSRHYGWQKQYGSPVPPAPIDHFTRYVVSSSMCWLWTGPLYETGYGHSPASTGDQMAHRAFYKRFIGEIPDGFDVDHQCHNRSKGCSGGWSCLHRRCVNPEHLGVETRSANLLLGHAAITNGWCSKGLHEIKVDRDWYMDPSTGSRRCRECWRISYRAASVAYRARLIHSSEED